MYSSPLPIDVDCDGFLDVVMLCDDGYLRAFDGSNNYGIPLEEQIGSQGAEWTFGSAAAADIDFDGDLEIAIGGQDGQARALAFELDGDPTPGWEDGQALWFDDARNAPALCDSNADGTVDLNFVDWSCMWRMFDGVGNLLQEGLTGADVDVCSSPAVGDLGPPKPHMGGDGIGPPVQPERGTPDLVVGSEYVGAYGQPVDRRQVWAWSTIQSVPGALDPELGIPGWGIIGWPKGRDNSLTHRYYYDSSAALADLDNDHSLDVVIGASHHVDQPGHDIVDGPVDVFTTADTAPKYYYVRPQGNAPAANTWLTDWAFYWFSSPAIAPLRSSTSRDIVIGGDDGRAYALYRQLGQTELQEVNGWAGGIDLNTDYAVSSSPSIADIDGDGYLEIVVGCDDGFVYVLDQRGRTTPGHEQDGIEYRWDCRYGQDPQNWPIICSPTITDVEPEGQAGHGVADILVANQSGLFKLNLPGDPPPQWDPDNAPWPMFRKDIGRTGCAEPLYPCAAVKGSVAGIVVYSGQPAQGASVYGTGPGNPPEELTKYAVSDGKYILAILTPGDWTLTASLGQGHEQTKYVTIVAGVQSRVDFDLP